MPRKMLTFDEVPVATRAEWNAFRRVMQRLNAQAFAKIQSQFEAGANGETEALKAYRQMCQGYYARNLEQHMRRETAEGFLAYQVLIGNDDAQYLISPKLDLPGKNSIKGFFEDVLRGNVRPVLLAPSASRPLASAAANVARSSPQPAHVLD